MTNGGFALEGCQRLTRLVISYIYTLYIYIYMYLVLPRDLDFILWEVSAVHKMLANVELEAQAERRCMN